LITNRFSSHHIEAYSCISRLFTLEVLLPQNIKQLRAMSLPIAIRRVSSFSRRKSGPSGRSASARRTRLNRAATKRPRMETSPRKSHSQRWVAKKSIYTNILLLHLMEWQEITCENTALFKTNVDCYFLTLFFYDCNDSLSFAFERARYYICEYVFFRYPM